MVLIPELPPEEISRQQALIRQFAKQVHHCDVEGLELIGNGHQKGVYKVKIGDQEFTAVAANRDKYTKLLEEYNILHKLCSSAPEFFPRAISHYKSPNKETPEEVMVMELLPHVDLDRFKKNGSVRVPDFHRRLAYELGRAVAEVHIRTGMYSSEPHDGNIMILVDPENPAGDLYLKFVDAIQFMEGSVEDAVRAMLASRDERPESYRMIKNFRAGLAEATSRLQGISQEQAYDSFEFLREFNDVF